LGDIRHDMALVVGSRDARRETRDTRCNCRDGEGWRLVDRVLPGMYDVFHCTLDAVVDIFHALLNTYVTFELRVTDGMQADAGRA
jgi:hypothetical protein